GSPAMARWWRCSIRQPGPRNSFNPFSPAASSSNSAGRARPTARPTSYPSRRASASGWTSWIACGAWWRRRDPSGPFLSARQPVEPRGIVVEQPALLVGGEVLHDRLEGSEDLVVAGMQPGHGKVAGEQRPLGAEGLDAGQHDRPQAGQRPVMVVGDN